MRWSEIEGEVWTIPAARRGKDREDHVVLLTPAALELIERARDEVERFNIRRKWPESVVVFQALTT